MPHLTESGITNWTPERLPDLSGRRFIITGGNSGIGFEAAHLLAARNADVVIACRNEAKGKRALEKLVNAGANVGAGRCDLLVLDLADMASIRAASAEASKRFGAVHALINNAGVMQTPKSTTADGFELQLGTNHLGHFLWTALMMPQVDQDAGRVVTVSSIMHKFGRINFDNLMMERGYNANLSYNRSKLANLMFALELHRRLEAVGSAHQIHRLPSRLFRHAVAKQGRQSAVQAGLHRFKCGVRAGRGARGLANGAGGGGD